MALTLKLTLLERPVVPFLGIAVLAFAATGLEPSGTTGRWWSSRRLRSRCWPRSRRCCHGRRCPSATLLALPISIDVVIAAAAAGAGRKHVGLWAARDLPVVWVGLTQRAAGGGGDEALHGLMFAVPIVLIGAPLYPETGWRSVVLWAVVSVVIGIGVNRAVAHQRSRPMPPRDRARGLAQLVETQTAIAAADTDLGRI